MIPLTWKHVEAQSDADFVVASAERLSWARTLGIGAQDGGDVRRHVPGTGAHRVPACHHTAVLRVGTVLFLLITGNRLPSYLGSSFSVIAPVTALGGLVAVGLVLIVIGVVVHVSARTGST